MKFEALNLKTPLSDYIEAVFYYHVYMPYHSIERVVPTGHVYILFELDGMLRKTFDNTTLKPTGEFSKVWISGLHKDYLSISSHAKSEMLVIQFKPFGAFPFLNFPLAQINDRVVAIEQVLGRDLLQVHQSMLGKDSPGEKLDLAEKWLHHSFCAEKAPPQSLVEMVTKLSFQPVAAYQQVIKDYPNTQKHLIAQFKKYVGLTPKRYHRILRFNDILQQINKKETITWTQITYQSGFSDQSHFIKEFKHFCGFNPQQFIEQDFNQNPTNFFPVEDPG